MTPELKSKWLTALRSGKFKQTRDRWRDSVGFCCLEVLCVVAGRDTQNYRETRKDIFASLWVDEKTVSLAIQWNDVELLSFPEIADRLEPLL